MPEPAVVALDGDLRDGDRFSAGALALEVLHTPGHTPGSVSFALTRPGTATMLLSGDTLFRGSVGRTDIGGTTIEELVGSIRGQTLRLSRRHDRRAGARPGDDDRSGEATNPYLVR